MMRKIASAIAALVVCLGMMTATASGRLLIELGMSPDGPAVYQSGTTPGWSLGTDVFVNAATGATAMGPIHHGRAPDPVIKIWMNRVVPSHWIAPLTSWRSLAVVFFGPHHQGAEFGTILDFMRPWPAHGPRVRRLASYRARRP